MKKGLLLLLFFSLITQAQINEIGGFIGGANYIGDIGATNYVYPKDVAFGLLYRWNQSPRHSYRVSLTMARVHADDVDSDVLARQQRGYSFKNAVRELAVGFEFNFFDFNLHEESRKVTPYVASGLSYANFDALYFDRGKLRKSGTGSAVGIPMILGIKAHIADEWVLGLEVGARYTFTDNFDGSNPNDSYQKFRFGNLNSNDWYVFSGLTLTYTFGQKPCYCAE
ncbi:MAG: hypothetical protein CFE24_14140 [Flavobacterium sp. BFFFF2]|nr:MAG: hypothetical protein CFE24_14140 [Flavobacterium sp. BFFFF2]